MTRHDAPTWAVRALLALVAVVAVTALAFGYDAQHEPAPTTTTVDHLLSIDEAPVWVLEDDGSWTCVPGGPAAEARRVCDCAVPPSGLGPEPAVVNEPWTCNALEVP
jgi:hypothetical protein